ncbi:NUDIX domain-containing protein [Actinomadura chokoriensis]|uniref:NUDIX domain-containing protein n=1 Tax=Actinomadura chokoriensis TaxID=454156 RepID=A0ABV4R6R4_9ACTN
MKAGRDYVGVGVGAMVFDNRGRIFLARRGPGARNEAGTWEFPGGEVKFGELMADAIRREFAEEYGMFIEPVRLLGVFDHLLPEEGQHWVSVAFVSRYDGGGSEIREPSKCSEIGWFDLNELPQPLSQISGANLEFYRTQLSAG